MRVIFLDDDANIAQAGEVKNVADGYARNYLIPKMLAVVATPDHLKRKQRIKREGDEKRVKETKQLEELASALDGTAITVKAKATPTGKFYGAVSAGHISDALASSIGREIDRKLIDMVEPIREPGEYNVVLNLGPDIQAGIIITAEAEE